MAITNQMVITLIHRVYSNSKIHLLLLLIIIISIQLPTLLITPISKVTKIRSTMNSLLEVAWICSRQLEVIFNLTWFRIRKRENNHALLLVINLTKVHLTWAAVPITTIPITLMVVLLWICIIVMEIITTQLHQETITALALTNQHQTI